MGNRISHVPTLEVVDSNEPYSIYFRDPRNLNEYKVFAFSEKSSADEMLYYLLGRSKVNFHGVEFKKPTFIVRFVK